MARKHNYHISQKTSNIILLAIPSLFIIIGIITIISTSITVANRNEFIKTAESCYSYVDYVHTYTTTSYTGTGKHRHRTTTTHYDAYVHYTVNGVTYSNMEIPGTTYRKIGDEIKIYYDPENPQTFITEPNVDEDIVFIFSPV